MDRDHSGGRVYQQARRRERDETILFFFEDPPSSSARHEIRPSATLSIFVLIGTGPSSSRSSGPPRRGWTTISSGRLIVQFETRQAKLDQQPHESLRFEEAHLLPSVLSLRIDGRGPNH
jgi:hypothetical protein